MQGTIADRDPSRIVIALTIGAILLDREDPLKVLRRLTQPLLAPGENERAGYVPNVVYSCGAVLHGNRLIIPYAMSDYATTFATVPLSDVLKGMSPVSVTNNCPW